MGFGAVPGRGGGYSLELSEEATGDWGGGGNRSRSEVGSGGVRSRDILRGRPAGPSEALRGAGPSRGDRRRNADRSAVCGAKEPPLGPGGARPLAVHLGIAPDVAAFPPHPSEFCTDESLQGTSETGDLFRPLDIFLRFKMGAAILSP